MTKFIGIVLFVYLILLALNIFFILFSKFLFWLMGLLEERNEELDEAIADVVKVLDRQTFRADDLLSLRDIKDNFLAVLTDFECLFFGVVVRLEKLRLSRLDKLIKEHE